MVAMIKQNYGPAPDVVRRTTRAPETEEVNPYDIPKHEALCLHYRMFILLLLSVLCVC